MKLVVTEKQRMGQLIASAMGQYRQRTLGTGGRRSRLTSYEVGEYVIVPLSGHIMNYITPNSLERWTHASVDSILNDSSSIIKVIHGRGYSQALRSLAESSSEVVIATDSDDEGENIGLEVLEILKGMRAPVKRLWLTTTVPSDIRESFSRLRQFNYNLALSVEARRKVDAILGFSGTRELTLSLKYRVGGKGVLSFGRVQTSTLWLVVKREREIVSFIPKPYWEITARVKNTIFMHTRSPFFDKEKAFETFSKVKDGKQFLCTDVKEEASFVQPPKPLNTSEMLKIGSSFLHISPAKVLFLAEDLYLSSKITYPRVDNQTYKQSFNHRANLQKLMSGNKFKDYAAKLVSQNFMTPTRGKFAEDHEPITPIASISEYPKNPLAYRLYELILRHYLSIFGPPAKFLDSKIDGVIKDEPFRAEGRKLLEPGFYEVYYYPPKEKKITDDFQVKTKYLVEEVNMQEKKTEPPPRYSNSTLLAEMERQGIGTKSTRPMMIQTLKDREYVKISRSIISPSEKGMKFISCIEEPWQNYISPEFTSRVEDEMEKVSHGEKDWQELVSSERRNFAEAIATFRKQMKK
ncbi:MAG: DNA topoisomerase [Thaumarchaeota archaeon]|nr:DNA topoisomerase [Nitrososphaerota archaeon]